jgi:hypothetical protein
MTDGCSLAAQIEVLWAEEGMGVARIARYLGIGKNKVRYHLRDRHVRHQDPITHRWTGPRPPKTSARRRGRPQAATTGVALNSLVALGGEARTPEWLTGSGLTSQTLEHVQRRLVTLGYVEPTGAPNRWHRSWRVTDAGRAATCAPDNRPLDHEQLKRQVETARVEGTSDLATAAELGISCRLVRKLAGRRDEPRAQGCTPCPACDRPVFRRDFQGLCRECAQRRVPVSVALLSTSARAVSVSVQLAATAERSVPVRVALTACVCAVCLAVGSSFSHGVPNADTCASKTAIACHVCGVTRGAQVMMRVPATLEEQRRTQCRAWLCPTCWEMWLAAGGTVRRAVGIRVRELGAPTIRVARQAARAAAQMERRSCARCGVEFRPLWISKPQLYCSATCRRASKQPLPERELVAA